VGLPNTKTGDTYIIEYLNPDNPKLNYSTERKVISVGDGKIAVTSKTMNSKNAKARTLQFTSEWNLISSRNPDGSGFDYAPPLQYFAFPLSPGKTWQQTSQETNIKTGAVREHTLLATVGEWEDISVPAGTFRALNITIHTELLDRTTEQRSTGTDISWYAPVIRRSVKSEVTSHNFQGQQERQVIQLMQYDVKNTPSPPQDGVTKGAGREDRQGKEAKNDSTIPTTVQTINPITEYIINNTSYNKSTPDGNEWTFNLTFKNGKYSNGYVKWMGDVNSDNVASEIRNKALGDLNGDNINDGVAIVTVNNGGSGTVNYLYALVGGKLNPTITEPVYLGDRTEIKSLNIISEKIVLDIKKHKQDDASCCPTKKTTLTYWLGNGKIVGSKFKDY
jgi:hypothetical protein